MQPTCQKDARNYLLEDWLLGQPRDGSILTFGTSNLVLKKFVTIP
jgi:hypothetical protein